MRRRTFDIIFSSVGGLLTVVLLAAGALLMWGYSFADSSVHDQLAAQQIYFPARGSDALKSADSGPYLDQYAGQQLVTGQIALYAAIATFTLAGVMLALSAFGLLHLRKLAPQAELLTDRLVVKQSVVA